VEHLHNLQRVILPQALSSPSPPGKTPAARPTTTPVEDLRAALEQFEAIQADLAAGPAPLPAS
jgi:hypothetical protein